MEGVPVVITGHKTWATWAHPWLKSPNPGPVDLSKNEHKLNVEAMVEVRRRCTVAAATSAATSAALSNAVNAISSQDIGDELVPVIRKDYSESAPIHGNIQAKTFLEKVRARCL